MLAEWQTRFRGWVGDWTYDFDPSQQVNRLTLELTDIFELLGAIEMLPGFYGDPPPAAGQILFGPAAMDGRIVQVLGNAGIPADYYVVFSGNVTLVPSTYSPGETPLDVTQDAADAEFPGVSNVYTDRFGRLAVHGRLAKFKPVDVASGAAPGAWDWHRFRVGDGAHVAADLGNVAQLRQFGFNRGLSKVINSALASPAWYHKAGDPPELYTQYTDDLNDDQIVRGPTGDPDNPAFRGVRSWSAQNLQTDQGPDGSDSLVETRRFADYYITNYETPRNRAGPVGFRTPPPGSPGEAVTWLLLTRVDISDEITVEIDSPGGGGFNGSGDPDAVYYVEGVHETVQPAGPDMDDITVTLDLSPKAYFADLTMFPDAA